MSLREQANRITVPIAKNIHEQFPQLSPNHITFLGLCGTTLSLVLNNYAQEKKSSGLRRLAALSYLASSATDALDGALARHINSIGEKHDQRVGQLVDVGVDRAQETIAALMRLKRARQNNQPLGVVAAALSGVTNFLPSYTRARAEARGVDVSETGGNPLNFLGTRAGRLATTMLGNFTPEIKGVNIAPAIDLLSTSANVLTTAQRIKATSQSKKIIEPKLAEKAQKATSREKMLKTLTVIGVGTIGLFLLYGDGAVFKKSHNRANSGKNRGQNNTGYPKS